MFEAVIILLIAGVAGGMFYLVKQGGGKKPQHHTHTLRNPQPATKNPPSTQAESLKQIKNDKRYWGVEIKTPGCMEAFKLREEHFPIETAPALPLPDCPAGDCTCTYNGLKEHRGQVRRINKERRTELRFDSEDPDRRSHKDRRRNIDKWKDRDF